MKLLIDDFEDELSSLAREAEKIKVMIAFLTESGLSWMPKELMPHSEFIVGIDLRITSPGAMKLLQENGSNLRVFSEGGRMFHPKAIYLNCGANEYLIIGSNNLTCSGICSNHEVAILIRKEKATERSFQQYHEHFECLKKHKCSFVPGPLFYNQYTQSSIRSDLQYQINTQEFTPLKLDPERAANFGLFLKKIAHDFPHLERKAGSKTKDHPLIVFNEEKFAPLLQDIVDQVSSEKLRAQSSLRQGGKWLNIPNIYARDDSQESWEDFDGDGAVSLQIHFSEDFKKVHFSIVISYNIQGMGRRHQMPARVEARCLKLAEHLKGFAETHFDLPVFFNWTNKERKRWDKPIISFVYSIDQLPDDETLIANLSLLVSALNSAMAIR